MPPEQVVAPGESAENPGKYKGQPWQLFDTIASRSFLLGDTTNGLAIGSQVPAISQNGEIVFFQSGGRSQATMPWYTNLDLQGQLAYGLQVWQVAVAIFFPFMPGAQTVDPNAAPGAGGVSGTIRLAEAILNYGVLSLGLGQENQIEWPLTSFGSGGGLNLQGLQGSGGAPQNSQAQASNVLKLPEPVEMGRTQNLNAKIKLAPEVFAIIGSPAAPGVGSPLLPYSFETDAAEPPTTVLRQLPPFAIQLKLIGRRVKFTQYGQVVR